MYSSFSPECRVDLAFMRTIDAPEYYGLSAKDLETMRKLLLDACRALEERSRLGREEYGDAIGDLVFLRECVEGHKHDEALALLSVAANIGQDDVLSLAALQLVSGHNVRGSLTGIGGWASLLRVSDPIRLQIQHLVNRAALLLFSEEDKANLGDKLAHLK